MAPRLTAIVMVLLVAWPVSAFSAAPQNVMLFAGRTEPVVAVDPNHAEIVVGAANTDYVPINGLEAPGYFSSRDAGKSFVTGNLPMVRPYTTGADSSVRISTHGIVFLMYLGETPTYCSGGRSALILTISRDGGRSFHGARVIDADPADDRPTLSLQDFPNGSTHLYVSWTRWHNSGSDIWFVKSTDGGRTFSRPVMLGTSMRNYFGSLPIADKRGHVTVFWSVFPEVGLNAVQVTRIVERSSSDDGMHWAALRNVSPSFQSPPRMMQPGSLRSLPAPSAAEDSRGDIFVTWARATTSHGGGVLDADIMITVSRNQGRFWSQPVRVNRVTSGDRFMPSITVLHDRSVAIAFYDRRRSWQTLDVYAVVVNLVGSTLVAGRDLLLNQTPSPIGDIYYIAPGSTCFSPGRFFGDYIGTASSGPNSVCVVWTGTQTGTYNRTEIWFARASLSGHSHVLRKQIPRG